ncbi:hypothetical protein [Antarcticimicrobium sediminis]|uniref:Uncharacterized protein n=1 Tax=Antarcticimicrobium sediminis TaxID=2546227 RepID=A0A4R5EK14_9RHOB|nr:hypothetical protein [Antarcticimicrobium sediminis]TDE34808.1 hypothetical protein E1B25_18935 [Antarcticimicrobium sediminis]
MEIFSMSYLCPLAVAAVSLFIATGCAAQTETGTMPVIVDGADYLLSVSVTNKRAKSGWSEAVPSFDQVSVNGFLEKGGAIDMNVYVSFGVLTMNGAQTITDADIILTERGTEGGWMTVDSDDPVVTLTTYEKSDAGVLVEGSFSGAPDYRKSLYKMTDERGAVRTVSGSFSILYPAK